MFNEISNLLKKYDIIRGLGFVPDRLEIITERKANGSIHLIYKERFTYLPTGVLERALENAVSFLLQFGVHKENIKHFSDGVEVELDGESELIKFPILELLIQNRNINEGIEQTCRDIKSSLSSLLNLYEIAWDYNTEIEEKWCNTLEKLETVIKEHPKMNTEIEEIIKKYSASL